MAIDQRRSVGFHVPRSATTLIVSLFKEDEALQDLAGSYSGSNTQNGLVVLEYEEEITQQILFRRADGAKSYLDLACLVALHLVWLS